MENHLEVEVVGLAGLPDDLSWSQTSVVDMANGSRGAVLVSLIAKEKSELLDLVAIGIKFVEELSSSLKGEKNPTIGKWTNELTKLKSGVGDGVEVRMGVLMLEGNRIWLVGVGVEAFISRANHLTKLIAMDKSLVKGVQGELIEADKAILATSETGEVVEIVRDSKGASLVATANRETRISSKRVWPKLYIGAMPRPKVYRYIGIALLSVLLMTIVVGYYKRGERVSLQKFTAVKSEVSDRSRVASEVVSSNPEQARREIAQARGVIEQYKQGAKGKYLQEVTAMAKSLDEQEVIIFKQSQAELNTWVELSLLGLPTAPTRMTTSDKGVIYFPTESGLGGLSISDKSQLSIKIPGTLNYLDYVVEGKRVYILGTDGIYLAENGQQPSRKVESDEAWQAPSRLLSFGGSLYVLDTGSGEISKYAVVENELAARKRWFGKGIVLDLSKIVDVVIDGDVWLLSSSGKLERYSRGVPVKFELLGFANDQGEKKLDDPVAVANSPDEVFVLERGKSRVVVFDKDGNYGRQYLNPGFAEGKDLVVNDGKGYVLTEKEIKVFGL